MDLYPAVDVSGGRVARAPRTPRAPGDDLPLAVARAFAGQGARWIHYVDLDRAFRRGENHAVTRALLGAGVAAVQVGGGLTEERDIGEVLEWGAARVVLGAAAAGDPRAVAGALSVAGADRLAVALDVAGGRLAPRGAPLATAGASLAPLALARRLRDQGVRTVVYTDVPRDGALGGADLAGALALRAEGLDVIVSGGIAALEEVSRAREAGLSGIVVGRALYEGRFTLAEALRCA